VNPMNLMKLMNQIIEDHGKKDNTKIYINIRKLRGT